jgi:hypothetical protein
MRFFAPSGTFGGLPRTAAVAASVALGAAALCLVVFGTSQKQLQLGVLLGLWSALIGACLVFGTRRGQPGQPAEAELAEARSRATELHEAQLKVFAEQQEQLQEAKQASFSQEIELRQFGELQLAREAQARRESELALEASLRCEIERVLAEQLGSLREEVAALRAEVFDKLGGQLRLERIETTRVIGSDLEALQHEIRRLAAASQEGIAAPAQPVRTRPAQEFPPRPAEIVDAELVEFPPPAAELPDARTLAEERAGRRRAPDSGQGEARYQGRRRADSDPAGRFVQAER